MQCQKKRVTLPGDEHTYESVWTPCQIVDYNEKKRAFQIIWANEGREDVNKKYVGRCIPHFIREIGIPS